MVEISSFGESSDLQLIHGYGDGGFRVSGNRHEGSILLMPRRATSWTPPSNLEKLKVSEILPLLGEMPPPLFVLGTGAAPTHPFLSLGAEFRKAGIAFELLSTSAACRTWNVLMSEGRAAAAGLVAVA